MEEEKSTRRSTKRTREAHGREPKAEPHRLDEEREHEVDVTNTKRKRNEHTGRSIRPPGRGGALFIGVGVADVKRWLEAVWGEVVRSHWGYRLAGARC